MTTKDNLRRAGKAYSECAKQLTLKSPCPGQPTASESELLIAFGIASDWSRRAAALEPLDYSSRLMRRSAKTPSISEIVRFNLAWSGMNALFSRNAIFALIGSTPPRSELDRFKLLVNMAIAPANVLDSYTSNLHNLLKCITVSFVPGHPAGTPLSVLQVLHEKYTPAQYRSMATGVKIQAAIASGNYASLDAPTLIYLMRNWSVHGGILSSSFRSVPRFNSYIGTVSEALAIIHLQLSNKLLGAI